MIGEGQVRGPHLLVPCAHHVPATGKHPARPSSEYPRPSLKQCSEVAYAKGYSEDQVKAASAYDLSCATFSSSDSLEKCSVISFNLDQHPWRSMCMKIPNFANSVCANMSLGVSLVGIQCASLVGDGGGYWFIANSWSEAWANSGTLKIARGNHERGISGNIQVVMQNLGRVEPGSAKRFLQATLVPTVGAMVGRMS